MPAMTVSQEAGDLIEITAFSFTIERRSTMPSGASIQNPTESRWHPPIFWSATREVWSAVQGLDDFYLRFSSASTGLPSSRVAAWRPQVDRLHLLRTDGGAQGAGEGLAEALDIGFLFGLDHDAGELLGAGVAQDHAPFVAKRGLRFG